MYDELEIAKKKVLPVLIFFVFRITLRNNGRVLNFTFEKSYTTFTQIILSLPVRRFFQFQNYQYPLKN